MRPKTRGQVLPIVMICLAVLLVIIAALVNWIQGESTTAIKEQKSSAAINLAEAGIDRGKWKLQSTTSTWTSSATGVIISSYNFDTSFKDIPGGTYRIKFTPGVLSNGVATVTITAEGRDLLNKETRALQSVVEDQVIYSALMSGGNVSWGQGLGVYWGPIMSQGNIQMMDDVVGALYFPRKFAKGSVIGTAANPRDTNGLAPPNTDNVEWWTEYNGVPPVPVLDFAALRSSAAATGTLNIYGCKNSSVHGADGATSGPAPWDLQTACVPGAGDSTPHNKHFGNSMNYIRTVLGDTAHTQTYVWYWDNDVTLTGTFCSSGAHPCSPGQSTGLRGNVIVRGNLTVDSPGDLVYNGYVPTLAWQEEQKLLRTTNDTTSSQEYPADIGYHHTSPTWNFGTDLFTQPGSSNPNWYATVGIRGFTYVGGNLNIVNFLDFNGAIWVNGSVSASYANANAFCGIYYDDTLQVPTLNVILLQLSWKEVTPSATTWAP